MRYHEGDIVNISLLKTTELSDSEKIFVFQTEHGDKFILDNKIYKHYNFIQGQTYRARIDRINCSGKIFFEPEHPIYKDLQTYNFDVLNMVSLQNTEAAIQVADCFNNSILVKVCPHKKDQQSIALKVAFVRKGIPLLMDEELGQTTRYKERESYPFILDHYRINHNGEEEMVFRDYEGLLQFLPASNYRHYALEVGQKVWCTIVRIKPGGILSLEPHHPYLKVGEILDLNYIAPLSKSEALHHKHKLHKLADAAGDIFLISDRFVHDALKKGTHRYRIDAFKKGQVYVEPV